MPKDLSGVLPSAVQVVYRTKLCSGNADPPIPKHYIETITLTQANAPMVSGYPGAKIFHDRVTAQWVGGGGANPTNKAQLHSLAVQIASDFYGWRQTNYDRVYNGTVSFDVEGYLDEFVLTYGLDPSGREITSSRVRGWPYNGEPEELLHAGLDCCDLSGVVVYAPHTTLLGNSMFQFRKVTLFFDAGNLYSCDAGSDQINACPNPTPNPNPPTPPPTTPTPPTPGPTPSPTLMAFPGPASFAGSIQASIVARLAALAGPVTFAGSVDSSPAGTLDVMAGPVSFAGSADASNNTIFTGTSGPASLAASAIGTIPSAFAATCGPCTFEGSMIQSTGTTFDALAGPCSLAAFAIAPVPP